jgi:hypothetical protein
MDLVYRIRAVRLVQNTAVRYKWLRAPATKINKYGLDDPSEVSLYLLEFTLRPIAIVIPVRCHSVHLPMKLGDKFPDTIWM